MSKKIIQSSKKRQPELGDIYWCSGYLEEVVEILEDGYVKVKPIFSKHSDGFLSNGGTGTDYNPHNEKDVKDGCPSFFEGKKLYKSR